MKHFIYALITALVLYSGAALAAVNVNTADADALTALPNIGPTKAAAIVEDREANGMYESLDDLTRVSGIGSKTVDALRGEAMVDGESDSGMTEDTDSES